MDINDLLNGLDEFKEEDKDIEARMFISSLICSKCGKEQESVRFIRYYRGSISINSSHDPAGFLNLFEYYRPGKKTIKKSASIEKLPFCQYCEGEKEGESNAQA